MVKRTASVPKAGTPSGNSLRVALAIFSAARGSIRPVVRLATRLSRSIPSIRSIGSSVLPFDLDIFWPCESRTRPCTYTVSNGTLPVKWAVIMTMRATQKKMMSKPVTSTDDGRNIFMSGVSSGQPMVEKGTRADENQVSSTSSSRRSAPVTPCAAALAFASSSSRATMMLPSSANQAGMRWPHHS